MIIRAQLRCPQTHLRVRVGRFKNGQRLPSHIKNAEEPWLRHKAHSSIRVQEGQPIDFVTAFAAPIQNIEDQLGGQLGKFVRGMYRSSSASASREARAADSRNFCARASG